MLGWIEKVVPQPPVNSPVPVVVEKAIKAEESPVGARSGLSRQVSEQWTPEESPPKLKAGGCQTEPKHIHFLYIILRLPSFSMYPQFII